jgi:predicted SAM-dependent methyltransferase
MSEPSIKLHLGCGRKIIAGWVNLDSKAGPGVDVVTDLDACGESPLPFDDDSVEAILAEHLLGHLRHPLPFMQELHRIAAPDCKAMFRVPYGSHDESLNDPTHVRHYVLGGFDYFGQPAYWRADYG